MECLVPCSSLHMSLKPSRTPQAKKYIIIALTVLNLLHSFLVLSNFGCLKYAKHITNWVLRAFSVFMILNAHKSWHVRPPLIRRNNLTFKIVHEHTLYFASNKCQCRKLYHSESCPIKQFRPLLSSIVKRYSSFTFKYFTNLEWIHRAHNRRGPVKTQICPKHDCSLVPYHVVLTALDRSCIRLPSLLKLSLNFSQCLPMYIYWRASILPSFSTGYTPVPTETTREIGSFSPRCKWKSCISVRPTSDGLLASTPPST